MWTLKKLSLLGLLLFYGYLKSTDKGRLLMQFVTAATKAAVNRYLLKGATRPRFTFEMEMNREFLSKLDWSDVRGTRSCFDNVDMPVPSYVKHQLVRTDAVVGEWVTSERNVVDEKNGKVILYLHGGGYCFMHPKNYRGMVGRIVQAVGGGCRAFMPDYRLAPENPFPLGIHDCVAAYQWLLNQGIPAKNISIVGDSAGGGLVLATLLFLRDEQVKTPLPESAVTISPWCDLRSIPRSYNQFIDTDIFGSNGRLVFENCAELYAKGKLDDYLVSPVCGKLHGLPRLLIQAGSVEQLLSNSIDLADVCKRDGVDHTLSIYEDMYHDFQQTNSDDSRAAINEIAAFICEKSSS